jgi:hypothetical protein
MRGYEAELMPICALPEEDAKLYTAWMFDRQELTCFDPRVIANPRCCMAKVTRNNETVAMVPIQPVLFFESLALKPDLGSSGTYLALNAIDSSIPEITRDTAICEFYFVTSDEAFANAAADHGWDKYLYDQEKHTWLLRKRTDFKLPDAGCRES